MSKALSTVTILWLLLVVACANTDDAQISSVMLATVTLEPTPTLLPGLPTNTPMPIPTPDVAGAMAGQSQAEQAPLVAPTPIPTPTATPLPVERLALGASLLAEENYNAAIEELQAGIQSSVLTLDQQKQALIGLGQAQLFNGQSNAASETLGELLALAATHSGESAESGGSELGSSEPGVSEAYYLLAEAQVQAGDCAAAIGAYESYLANRPEMGAYVQPRLASCYLALEDRPSAISAYKAAVSAEALPQTNIALRQKLAQIYLEDDQSDQAIAQYEAILKLTEEEQLLGQSTYQIGWILLQSGETAQAYDHYLAAVNNYPRAYESYLALIALIEAGIEVDAFQRGLVDFYAEAYEAALASFTGYVAANPEHREDVHLYLAWSYERLGNVEAALAEIDTYIEANLPDESPSVETIDVAEDQVDPLPTGEGWIERAKMQLRAGMTEAAIESYLSYLKLYPDGEKAPFAAWWAAALAERMGDSAAAVSHYLALVEAYPDHDDAPEALFRAGYLSWHDGDLEAAVAAWELAAERYQETAFGSASLIWLLRSLQDEQVQPYLNQVANIKGDNFYSLRAQHIASDTLPFQPATNIDLSPDPRSQEIAEDWLRNWLAIEGDAEVSDLAPGLASDGRLIRGRQLWQLGLREEAKAELESLRRQYADDPLASYQLALFFRDLGLYRSSILAANSLLQLADATVFEAPSFVGRLVYPVHYAELIQGEAERYGYDPLLQFALIRQESLFESFATSSAVAQGLSQVIPDTGAYIAQRLNWPNFQNEDLYKPYVGVAFGAFYLAQQLDAFDGDVAAALSAYNAGPGNADRWHQQAPDDFDLYHELVDFAETRSYIERIYVGHAIYRHLYGE